MPKNNNLRIVIDTNLWISFIISNKIHLIDQLFIENKITLLFSIELIEEIESTMQKPKLEKYFKPNSIDTLLTVFDPYIEIVNVKSNINICRDFKDNFLLSLAKDGKANYLITGDKDLLILNKLEKTNIITMADFSALISK